MYAMLQRKKKQLCPLYFYLHFALVMSTQNETEMSRNVRFAKMWYVRPAKPQISLRICSELSEPLFFD